MVKVPKKTSIYIKEPQLIKHTIRFAPELVPFILSGEKVQTYRYGDKYDYLKKGDVVNILNDKGKKIVCRAAVTDKKHTSFGNLPLDTSKHETYDDKEHQRKVFSGYYAYLKRPLKDSDPFLILEFKLLNK